MRFHRVRLIGFSALLPLACCLLGVLAMASPALAVRPHPILFVTQPPFPGDFTSMNAVFGNHRTDFNSSNRGGDLWILYPNGQTKNLTAAAGYGSAGMQGANAIAVREPSVHWTGTKAVFSMVVGAPTQRYQQNTYYWQLYEISGLGEFDTPVITKVPRQPTNYNNVSPIYGTAGNPERILFTSDRPRSGQRHHWPQLDEYESAPTVTGIWSLDPQTGEIQLLNHAISGVFSPSIDSYGRLVFIRWDHLQRDQQADADAGGGPYGTFNYANESANAARLNNRDEVFPEPRAASSPGIEGLTFNQFFPWAMNEDGTNEETVNHLGRHDFGGYFNRAFNNIAGLIEFIPPAGRANLNPLVNYLQMRESPFQPGRYFGIDAPEFGTHAAGQVVSFDAPPNTRPDQILVNYWTHRDTHVADSTPSANHSGLYRSPLPLSDGTVVVSHTTSTQEDANTGTRANPGSRYQLRLKMLNLVPNQGSTAGALLTPGISKSISYWDPDVLVSYSGLLWELDPVEVRVRTKPATTGFTLDPIEQGVFAAQDVDLEAFRNWLRARDLALIVTRDVTTRDKDDRQQPFNLRVVLDGGGLGKQTVRVPAVGPISDVADLQIVQADQIRGMGGTVNPRPGRRPIAQFMHDLAAPNPPNPGGPPGSVAIAADGSVAALVPARRAVSWQLTSPTGLPVVHERYWLTMQPGEIRTCTSCHGMSFRDQAGQPPPINPPQALAHLLTFWKTQNPPPPAGEGFFTVQPCRLLDTREPDGAAGGPSLVASGTRALQSATRCGVPPDARAISVNVTVTDAAFGGFLVLYAADHALPGTSTVSFASGSTRANNAVVGVSNDGLAAVRIRNGSPSGVHVVVDVNGYFQ